MTMQEVMATKDLVEKLAQRTKKMVESFNIAVDDLSNQIDTTDTYIENYLPLKTLKELTYLMENCFERKVVHKIQLFEADRVKELYAKMLQTTHKIPDFKTRLINLQKDQGKIIPGFSKVRNHSSRDYTDSLNPIKASKSQNGTDWIKSYSNVE
jgi:hypothetical protein